MTIEEIVLATGMSYEEAKQSWALRHLEEARTLLGIRDALVENLRETLPSLE